MTPRRYTIIAGILVAIGAGGVGAYVGVPTASVAAPAAPVTFQLPDSTRSGFRGTPDSTQLYDEHDTGALAGQTCTVTLTVVNNDSGRAGTEVSIIGAGFSITAYDIEATPDKVTVASGRIVVPAKLRGYVHFGEEGAVSIKGTEVVSDCGEPVTTTVPPVATVPAPPTTTQPPVVVSPIALPKFTG